MSRINFVNRRPSPCKGCTRERKKIGCHDSCPDFAKWKAENAASAEARQQYLKKRYGY